MAVESFELPTDHPGFADAEYRQRRAAIAAASAAGEDRPPRIDYSAVEDDVWSSVCEALDGLHRTYAIAEYRVAARTLGLSRRRVPQLAEVSDRLRSLTGWQLHAVPGLVPTREFYGSLAERTFLSTQYVRHPSVPFYTPEPDVIHELIGHVNALASVRLARLYEAAGRASVRVAGDAAALDRFSRVFWFTLEFGVVLEAGEVRTYGAGLLSSFAEIQAFRQATLLPFDTDVMAARTYDITRFQDLLFLAESFDEAEAALLAFFATC